MTFTGSPTKPKKGPAKHATARDPGRPDAVIRSAVLALLTYALGLIPFYFLTPVHEALPSLLDQAPRPIATLPPAMSPTARPTRTDRSIPAAVPSAHPTPQPLGPTPTAPMTADQRYAFVLLGYGGASHEGAYLTDSIMVVLVDPAAKSLTLLSIPRDIWVPLSIDGESTFYNKINTAYAFARDPSLFPDRRPEFAGAHGAGTFASATISRLIGVPIRYYVGLDFDGFRQMIDAVGGVDVDVPVAFAALYPANDDPSIDASWMTVRFTRGPQHFNGERAIQYARARETIDDSGEGTDYARSRRQRLIMEAFKARLFEPGGAIQLPRLLSIAARHVDTNYGIPDVPALGQLLLDWKSVRIFQTALTADNYLEAATGPQNTFALVPSEDAHSWAQIQAFTRHLWDNPALGVALANTKIIVENDTGRPGAAGQLTAQLAARGYRVGAPVSGPTRDESQIIDQTALGAAPLIAQLAKDLSLGPINAEEDPDPEGDTVLLNLGRRDLSRLDALEPITSDAPSGTYGIVTFGSWSPVEDTPTPTPRPPATATPVRVANWASITTPTSARKVTPISGRGAASTIVHPRPSAPKRAVTSSPGPMATSTLVRAATSLPKPTATPTLHPVSTIVVERALDPRTRIPATSPTTMAPKATNTVPKASSQTPAAGPQRSNPQRQH